MKFPSHKCLCYSLVHFSVALLLLTNSANAADYPENRDYGDKGDFIAKRGTEYGRTAILMPIGPLLVNLPEQPGSSNAALDDAISQAGLIPDTRARDSVWNLTTLNNPTLFRQLTCDPFEQSPRTPSDCTGDFAGQPINAHATVVRFEEHGPALFGGTHDNITYHAEARGTFEELRTDLESDDRSIGYLHMTAPYYARTYWAYGFNDQGQYAIRDVSRFMTAGPVLPYTVEGTEWESILGPTELGVWLGEPIIWWDHLGLTGVTGFSSWHGNLLVVASDQQNTGLAVYDASGIHVGRVPRLLGTYTDQRTQPNGIPIGVGGYWSEPYGATKIVYAARQFDNLRHYPAFYIIDFEDPTQPRLSCELYFNYNDINSPNTNLTNGDRSSDPMYVNFQDHYAYVDHFQVDMNACETAFADGDISDQEFTDIVYKFDDIAYGCDSSQYFRPIGQVGIFGGYDWWETPEVNEQGMCFMVTSDGPDNNPPYVAGHRPLPGQTGIPIDTFIHIHIPETLRTETVVDSVSVIDTTGNTVSFRYQLAHTGIISVWPDQDLAPNTEYTVDISGIQDFMGNTMEPYSFTFTTNDGDLLTGGPPPLPVPSGAVPTYQGGYFPNKSNQMACSPDTNSGHVWVVNPDNDTVAIVNRQMDLSTFETSHSLLQEIGIGYEAPTSVTKMSNGLFAVTYRDDDKVVFFNSGGMPQFSIDTGHGTQPVSSVGEGNNLYVSLYASGEVIRINSTTRVISARLDVGPYPKAMALSGDRLLITRFISPQDHGQVYEVNIQGEMSLVHTFVVNKVLVPDDFNNGSHGSGVPNYLASIVIDQSGERAYITAKKDNVDRGTRPESSNPLALDSDNTVRAMVITLDLTAYEDLNTDPSSPSGTDDLDNVADPSGISYLANPAIRVVALQGNNNIVVTNTEQNTSAIFSVGSAPQEICTTPRTAYVKNFSDRTISALNIAGYLYDGRRVDTIETVSTVQNEVLSDTELRGLQLFYHSGIPEMGPEGYMSCASCHVGGGHDGRTWDLTNLGEGLRNTISLNGASGTRFGNLHWSANFDEVQDFELQMEQLNGGHGLIEGQGTFSGLSPLGFATTGVSADLDALAAYVNGLGKDTVKRSPYRTYTGQLSEAAARGEVVFQDLGCASCHSGEAFRDGLPGADGPVMHDVGTTSADSGQRLGSGPLSAIRTPTLIELWDSAPYFHNGSAATLEEVLETGTAENHDISSIVNEGDRDDLIEYLLSIDRELYIDDQ